MPNRHHRPILKKCAVLGDAERDHTSKVRLASRHWREIAPRVSAVTRPLPLSRLHVLTSTATVCAALRAYRWDEQGEPPNQ